MFIINEVNFLGLGPTLSVGNIENSFYVMRILEMMVVKRLSLHALNKLLIQNYGNNNTQYLKQLFSQNMYSRDVLF